MSIEGGGRLNRSYRWRECIPDRWDSVGEWAFLEFKGGWLWNNEINTGSWTCIVGGGSYIYIYTLFEDHVTYNVVQVSVNVYVITL